MSQAHSLIVYAQRTAIGKMLGALSQQAAPSLGAVLVKDALAKTAIKGEQVDEFIMGQVLTAGVGQAPARRTAIYGGLPQSVCATTINRVCGSGLKAVMLGDQAIRLGEAQVVFAGGQENMSLAPHLLPQARLGYRFGPIEAKDHLQWDGLWDPYQGVAMGQCGEVCARHFQFSRAEQDAFARESYQRARQAHELGHFQREIVPVPLLNTKQASACSQDEEPFSVDLERLSSLRPAFAKDGTVTAGNASSINDGAALTVLTSPGFAQEAGLKPLARIVAQASFAHDPAWFTTAPIHCIHKVLEKAGLKLSDIDLFEINEAFAVVALAAMRELKISHDRVNVHGGAVALGHPIGASGSRVLVTLLHAMRARQVQWGLATLCIGGGEASAVIVENLS